MTAPELKGKAVIVTGGANGIGAAMVRLFHQQGAIVHFCDLDRRAGRSLERELGDGVSFAEVDLTSEARIRAWMRALSRRRLRLRALVNNAALDPRIPLPRMTAAQWDDLFALNLRAYFLMVREALPLLSKGASILNFSSITIHLGPPNMTAYVATKGGILGFTRSLARELGPRRIRVNALSPGWVMTERQLRQYVTPSIKRRIRQSQCIPELIEPEDVAAVALFLASDASRAMTGQELLVDRGWAHA